MLDPHDDVVNGDVDELDEEADESHDGESDGGGDGDLLELLPVRLCASLHQPATTRIKTIPYSVVLWTVTDPECLSRIRIFSIPSRIQICIKEFKQCCGSGSGIRCLFDPWIPRPYF